MCIFSNKNYTHNVTYVFSIPSIIDQFIMLKNVQVKRKCIKSLFFNNSVTNVLVLFLNSVSCHTLISKNVIFTVQINNKYCATN